MEVLSYPVIFTFNHDYVIYMFVKLRFDRSQSRSVNYNTGISRTLHDERFIVGDCIIDDCLAMYQRSPIRGGNLFAILQEIHQILQANIRFVPDSQDISHIPQVLIGLVPILHALPNIKAISHAHIGDCTIPKSCGDYKRQ